MIGWQNIGLEMLDEINQISGVGLVSRKLLGMDLLEDSRDMLLGLCIPVSFVLQSRLLMG